ncbi:methionine ABC transporter ATP-binding protein [Aedoeadaptatus pacaensis]|uniref:methionine ABC transporter ATP-binding protein n=1 Tax=Aedoeadaptatus pacaensis TaxID=1776390 RepID=UPI000838C5DD|nr:ATP-binding cassette domain-containing protein [Peptoniphilus pacaensis]
MIKVDHLSKQYDGKTVLHDLNFEIHEGDIFGIIGRSGSGKTTLLDCISGLKDFDEGSIFIDGENIGLLNLKDARAVRKEIGFVFQNFSLLSRRNVIQNIALPLKCWGYDDAEIQERTNRLAEMVGLEDHVTKKPKELSGGQKQRVAIARALSMDPRYIVCDEFTSALDPATTQSILDLMLEIQRERHVTIILVTHDMEVAKKMCNRVILLENGNIVESGTPEDVFSGNSAAVSRLLGGE